MVTINGKIEALYREHGHYVFSRCRSILGDEEEAYDALQEVFVRVIRSRPSFDDDRPILAFVNKITTNHCLNRLRARKYRRHLPLDEVRGVARADDSAEFLFTLAERRELIRRLLVEVDERTQRVVISYFFDENHAEGVAAVVGVSVPTVRRILKRFLNGARKKLEAEQLRIDSGAHSEVSH